MGSVIGTVASIIVGGVVATVTVVGVVNSQTSAPEESPGDVHNISVEYGSN